ncbi:MAG: dienelactone hydrolase family protein [Deltaproteobacteria bacterium]|nr:dienelactone hydrolase family protein [Deltaproteobacteria bacterium]
MKGLKLLVAWGVFSLCWLPVALGGEVVEYQVDGGAFEGYQARAKGSAKGLVVVIHDWDGPTDYEHKRAEMISALGYDVFAIDLYGKGNRPQDTDSKRAESGKLYKDRETMRRRLMGGLQQARKFSRGKTVVIGYCFGGSATLELARSGQGGEISGYVSFHGGLATPQGQSYPKSTSPVLILHGGADSAVSMDDVSTFSKELETAGINYEIQVYSGAPHAFTVFGSDRYRKEADEKSWKAFLGFLTEYLPGR